MEITEVRIKLMEASSERLKAFCSITFDDCFVIRDLKIIEGSSGPFVAMPSRKLTAHCDGCGMKNHLRSNYCNQCGRRLDADLAVSQAEGRAKLYADIAHPINSACREMIQEHVIRGFEEELERAQDPNYESRYDDFDYDPSDSEPATRIDAAHAKMAASQPHHPPQGDPSRPTTAPATGGDSSSAKSSAAKQHSSDQEPGGFGAGIF